MPCLQVWNGRGNTESGTHGGWRTALGSFVDSCVNYPWWRCRESNPGPMTMIGVFSGRSHYVRVLGFPASRGPSGKRSPVTVTVPRIPVTGIRQLVIFTTPETIAMTTMDRRTSFRCARLRRRGRSQCAGCWHLLVPGTDYEVTPATQPASLVSTVNVETCHPPVQLWRQATAQH